MEALSMDPTNPLINTARDQIENHQFSQEFQFIGTALNESIDYVAGLYYFDESGSHYQNCLVTMPASALTTDQNRWVSSDTKSYAAYAQATWTPPILDHRMDITLGARYTRDKRTGKRRFIIDHTDPNPLFTGIQVEDPATARNSKRYSKFNPAQIGRASCRERVQMRGGGESGRRTQQNEVQG